MSEHLSPRMREHLQFLQRYLHALDTGDLTTLAAVLRKAEHDPALLRLLVHLNEISLAEDHPEVFHQDLTPVYRLLAAYRQADALPDQPVAPQPASGHQGYSWRNGAQQMNDRIGTPAASRRAAPPVPPPRRFQRWWNARAALAIIALAVVVALFVTLFRGFAGEAPTQTGRPGETPTPAPTPVGQFTPAPGLSNLKGVPVIAASNPQVVYALTPESTGTLVLSRTTDGGKTWKTFSIPAGTASDELPPTIFVNPVDAQSVFLTVGGTRSGTSCLVSHALASDTTFGGGQDVCALQYLSKDGGAQWTQIQFPQLGIVSDAADLNGAQVGYNQSMIVHPQGSRLYAAFSSYSQENSRLIESLDGGSTWQFIDNGLSAAGALCDVAAASTGTTVFAITDTTAGCSTPDLASLTLWRSDDAGVHWSRVGTPPGNSDQGFVAESSGHGAQPVLYLNAPTLVSSGSTLPPADRSSSASGLLDLYVSADGGKTWQAAPLNGLPVGDIISGGTPMGFLSDSSLAFAIFHGSQGLIPTMTFYTWKRGAPSWRQITPTLSGGVAGGILTSPDSSGKQSIWVITASPGQSPNGPLTYSALSYILMRS